MPSVGEPIDWQSAWNFADPAGSQSRFEELLATPGIDTTLRQIITTQLARSFGLQREFDRALATLESLAMATDPEVRVRVLLERGRVLNTSGVPERAAAEFQSAADLAAAHHLWLLHVDSIHMLAIVAPTTDEQIALNLRGLGVVRLHPEADRWTVALNNNLGEIYRSLGQYEKALDCFRAIIRWQAQTGRPLDRYARVDVAKMLRLSGRQEEGLTTIAALAAEPNAAEDGFVLEELAESLLSSGRIEEAGPLFTRAWQKLQHERWLEEAEPQRYLRLKDMAARP